MRSVLLAGLVLVGALACGEGAPAPDVDAGASAVRLRLLTWNVENLFDDVDDPDTADDVLDPAELAAKVADVGTVIAEFDPDFVALQEVEAESRVLNALVTGPLAAAGFTRLEAGRNADPRGIDVAYLARPSVREIVSNASARFPNPDGGTTSFARDLLQVRISPGGNDVWVLIAHFISRRSPDNDGRRLAEAREAAERGRALTAAGDARVILLGDVNDEPGTPPYDALIAAGLVDLTRGIPPVERYTFRFRGENIQLDHALATPALADELRGITIVHTDDTERASDHEPIVMDIDVRP